MVVIRKISAMKKRSGGGSKSRSEPSEGEKRDEPPAMGSARQSRTTPYALKAAAAALRAFALGYPGAREEFPWGERVVKVGKKVFVFMGMADGDELGLSVKLPASGPMALLLPFAQPTGYGLGKAGWVSASFATSDDPPLALLREWIDESYRAVAPKTMVAKLPPPAGAAGAAPVSETARRTGPRGRRPSGKRSARSTARGR
jgi:predicted DNA-binding protein (MmcQ/YjbR family)